MKQREMREREIFYCDICTEECGLPYYGVDEIGYGSCCSSLMRKLAEAGVIDELREKVPQFAAFFDKREAVLKAKTVGHIHAGKQDEI